MDLASIKKFFASLTLQKLVPVILIVVIGLLLVKLLLKLFDRVLERSRLERTMFSFLRAAMRALLYTILVLVAASSLGVDVTSLVAILSVVSLAISLAVQNALSNVVGSVTLLTTHPFHVGDFVEIGSDSGTVEEISVSYTKLATVDGKRIYIPNSDAASARICNYSVEGRRRVDLYIGVSYDAPAEKVREALLAAAQHPKALQDPAPLVVLNNYQDSSIQYLLMLWTASGDYLDVRFAVNEAVKYTQERVQFKKRLSQFQNTQFQLADMHTRMQAAQYVVYAAAMKKQNHEPYSMDAAMAKLFAAEAASDVTRRAVQLFGGYGYTREYPVERMMRDAKITEIYEGTSEVQRMVISSHLGVK